MTTSELIQEIHKRTLLKRDDIANVVSLMLKVMKISLRGGESVKLRGFGTLYVKELKGRTYFGGKRVASNRRAVRFNESRREKWKSLASNSTPKK